MSDCIMLARTYRNLCGLLVVYYLRMSYTVFEVFACSSLEMIASSLLLTLTNKRIRGTWYHKARKASFIVLIL